jgi:hypothetical protein
MARRLEQFWKPLLLFVLAVLLWFAPGWAGMATAQELSPDSNRPEAARQPFSPAWSELDSGNISSEKVSQFVRACLQVVALIERREGELQGAETESESLRIEQEIEAEALAIIEQAGLTRQEYVQLLGLANTVPEFGERIAMQLQEAAT